MNLRESNKRANNVLKATTIAINDLKKVLSKDFDKSILLLKNRSGNIIVTGVGKSGFIAQKIAATLTSLGNRAIYLNPTDSLHGDSGLVADGDIIIAISFSGDSSEIVRAISHIKNTFSVKVISITGNKNSKLAKFSDVILKTFIKNEGDHWGLAPMASTTAALAVGDMLSAAITEPKKFQKHHFAKFHPHGSLGLSLKKIDNFMITVKDLPKIFESNSFASALVSMSKGKRGVVAVLSKNKKLVGVITDGDVRRILINNDSPKNLSVSKVMTRNPQTILSGSSLKDALLKMDSLKITSLFVVDKNKNLKGLIHIRHIMGFLS